MRLKRTIATLSLSALLIVSNFSYVKADINTNKISAVKTYIQEKGNPTETREGNCEKCSSIKEKYDTVFKNAEKYVPGISLKGELLYNERIRLNKEIGTAFKKQKDMGALKAKEEMKKEILSITKQMEEGKITKKEGKRLLEKKRKEYQDTVKNFRKEYKSKNKEEINKRKAQKKKTKQAFDKFVKAVESRDAVSIEQSFNSYYENSKILNEMLIKYIDDMKSESN